MPTLKLLMPGALRLLNAELAVLRTGDDMVTTADVWWTGPKLEHLEDWLVSVEESCDPRPELAFVGRARPSKDTNV